MYNYHIIYIYTPVYLYISYIPIMFYSSYVVGCIPQHLSHPATIYKVTKLSLLQNWLTFLNNILKLVIVIISLLDICQTYIVTIITTIIGLHTSYNYRNWGLWQIVVDIQLRSFHGVCKQTYPPVDWTQTQNIIENHNNNHSSQ